MRRRFGEKPVEQPGGDLGVIRIRRRGRGFGKVVAVPAWQHEEVRASGNRRDNSMACSTRATSRSPVMISVGTRLPNGPVLLRQARP